MSSLLAVPVTAKSPFAIYFLLATIQSSNGSPESMRNKEYAGCLKQSNRCRRSTVPGVSP
jgi:hypothetical protein